MVSRAKRNNMCCERSDVPYLPPAGWVDNESEYFASQTRNSLLSKLNLFAYGPGDDGMNVDAWGARKDGNGNSDSWRLECCCFLFFWLRVVPLHSTPRPPPPLGRAQNKKIQTNLLSEVEEIQGAGPRICIWLAGTHGDHPPYDPTPPQRRLPSPH